MAHLRVALIQAGRIVEDRTFPPSRGTITVGSAEDCTFLVPMADVPTRATVFEQSKHGTTLHFTRDADGRVSLGDGDHTFEALAATATPKGNGFTVALTPRARGRIAIGEVSLLFQFVEPTAKPPPAQLPKGAKGLLAQVDRSFLLVLGLSLAAHFAGVGWLSTQPVPEERDLTLDEMPDRFAAVILPLPKKTPETAPTQNEPQPKPTPKEVDVARGPKVPKPAPQQPASREQIVKLGLAGIIGSKGPGDGSAFGDILADAKINDVANAIKDASGVSIASAEDAVAARRRGNETGDVTTVEMPGSEGVKEVKLGERGPTQLPPTAVTVDTGPIKTGPELPEDELARWLTSRKPAVQSCYERQLKRQPTLAGRLVIRFDITPRGRVGKVGFEEDTLRSPAVEGCIAALMRGWVLPFQPEDDTPVAMPFIFTATR